MKDSNWDLDLRAGELGEQKIADLLSADTIEVKTDRRWWETGNVYIETECYYQASQSWEPSGMSVSKATHWAFLLEDTVLITELSTLKIAVKEYGRAIACNIPPNPSRGFLIRPEDILQQEKNWRIWTQKGHEELDALNQKTI